MAPQTPTDATIARSPDWLAHRFDPGGDQIHYVHAPRATLRQATFLTDEYLPSAGAPRPIQRSVALAAATQPAPVHFVFHSAYCCSTLVARAFDVDGLAVALKEPVILNDISGWRRRGAEPPRVAAALDHALTLLARPFAAGETMLIKPSNVVNALAPAMIAMRPAAHVLLLHAPLETYLASIAAKGMWGRLWVRELLAKLLRDGIVELGFENEDYLRHTDLQAAAVGWLAQHRLFARLVERFGAGRVRTLDSEMLLGAPDAAVTELSRLFGYALDAEAVAGVAAGPAFTRHSKSGGAFDQAARGEGHDAARAAHADEITKVVAWAEAVAERSGIPMHLPAPLLG